jgi:hypothetical protein
MGALRTLPLKVWLFFQGANVPDVVLLVMAGAVHLHCSPAAVERLLPLVRQAARASIR